MHYSVINMPQSIIYKEKYGATGHSSVYVRNPKGDSTLVQLSTGLVSPPQKTILSTLLNFFAEVFLPQGYPESVRDDYCSYQIWDTVQAFCSTISGILTTHAIMKSVGVGDATATALSATITWVLKDGIGMIGRIMFAWWKGHALDTDSKKWRLFADIINDLAMFFELLLLPMYPQIPTQILCLTTSMKGLVGVAGGASRASITQHHAIRGNTGDVSAKDGSQETCVNLVASTLGMALLSYTNEDMMLIWLLFSSVTILHVYANYKAVKALRLVTFNAERLNRYLYQYIITEYSYSPKQVNNWESVFVGITYKDWELCGFRIKLGYSIRRLVERGWLRSEEVVVMADLFCHRRYLLLADVKARTVFVLLTPEASTQDVLQAYFHSVLLAITVCHMAKIPLEILKELHKSSLLKHIEDGMKKFQVPLVDAKYSLEALAVTDDIIDKEFMKFFEGVKMQGWNTENHSLEVDEWRGHWCESDLNESSKNK